MVNPTTPTRENCTRSIEGDKEKLSARIKILRDQTENIFSGLESSLLKELKKEKDKVLLQLKRVEQLTEDVYRHTHWVSRRLSMEGESLPQPFYGIEAILKILFYVSVRGSERDLWWEEGSFAFLIPSVFQRTLEVDSQGYLLDEPVDPSKIQYLCEQVSELVPSSEGWDWDPYMDELRLIWVEILTDIYGGADPLWEEDVPLSQEEAINWKRHPVYTEITERVR